MAAAMSFVVFKTSYPFYLFAGKSSTPSILPAMAPKKPKIREGDNKVTGMVSVLAEPPRYSSGRSMRAVEITPVTSLNAGEELS